MTEHDRGEDGYAGQATVLLDGAEIDVSVRLRGLFQPIDGYYHWYGRIAANEALSDLVAGAKKTAVLRTPEGEATGQIADPDPWNRLRITGTSRPPFAVPDPTEEIAEAR